MSVIFERINKINTSFFCLFYTFLAQDSNEAHTQLHGIIAGAELPFPVSPSNACTKGLTCPVVAGESHIYTVSLDCPWFAPAVSRIDYRC